MYYRMDRLPKNACVLPLPKGAKAAPPVGYNTTEVLDYHVPLSSLYVQMTPLMHNIACPVGYNLLAVIDVDHTYL